MMASNSTSGEPAKLYSPSDDVALNLDLACLRAASNGCLASVSEAFSRISGRSVRELAGRSLFEVLSFETSDEAILRDMLVRPHAPIDLCCRLNTPEGSTRSVSLRVASLSKEGGVEAVAFDVTPWVEERDALRQETEQFRNVAQLIAGCAYSLRVLADGSIEVAWVLGDLEKLSGYTGSELRERGGWQTLIHPDDRPSVDGQVRDLLAGRPCTVEYRIIAKDETVRRVRDVASGVFGSPEGRVMRIEGVRSDVTAPREMERALAESRDRYRALFESVNAGIFIADVSTGIVVDANTDAQRLVGRSRDELIGMHQSQLHPSDQNERYREMFRQHVGTERVVSVEAEVVRANGDRVPVAIYGSQSEFNGRVCQIGVFHDLTEGKRAEAALRKDHALRQAIIDHAAEGISVCQTVDDPTEVQFTLWNDRMVELTGYTLDEINSIGWFQAMWPDSILREQARARLRRLLGGEEQFGDVREVVRKDGQRRRLSFSTSVIEGELGGAHILALISDMTDRERMLEQLRQSEKMEAIGHLAGGIAHDINNQLAGIMGLAELLTRQLSTKDVTPTVLGNAAERASQIVDVCRRARGVTHQLLAFARRGRYRTVNVDVHEVVEQVVSMLSHTIDKRIRLVVDSAPGIGITRGDPSQLHSALLNIAINARDAMPQGGQITFRVTLVDAAEVSRDAVARFVEICVTDTGTGMSDTTKQRIFEPFFTTKELGKGTGMGLAAAYGTIENHGGSIEVDSRLGEGTTFRILLPYQPEPTRQVPPPSESDPRPQRMARILLADDEETVRDTLATMLRHLGHDVITCVDGQEALDAYDKRWREIDLVVLDMVMPRRGGPDVFRDMLRLNPNVRALLISGHTVDLEAREVLAQGARGFLQKPFSIDALMKVVDQVLANDSVTPGLRPRP